MMDRIRCAPSGQIGAVAFYDPDRLHRNALEFFQFMAECEQRQILVFDSSGLIRNEDELSWGIKAVVASAERRKIAKRVHDNMQFLKRRGKLLGVLPAGYQKVDSKVIEDPATGPVVREIFSLYATGKYSMRSLADNLNRRGIKPPRNPKRGHNRPLAVICTDGVLKDLLRNPSYLGKVHIGDQLVDGQHPQLVDKETFDRCQAVRVRNTKRVTKVFRRYSYPLAPVLTCGRCGGRMYGEASYRKGEAVRLYYGCSNRRRQLARNPNQPCNAPWVSAPDLEAAIRNELGQCVHDGGQHEALRVGLRRGVQKAQSPKLVTETAIRRLEEQLARVKRLYEFGEYTWGQWIIKRDQIRQEQAQLREQAATYKDDDNLEWCETQMLDLVRVWDLADASQRARLLSGIFADIEVEKEAHQVSVVAVPRPPWKPFFERVVASRIGAGSERETRVSRAVSAPSPPIRFSPQLVWALWNLEHF